MIRKLEAAMLTRRSLIAASALLLPAAARAPALDFLVVGDWGRGGGERQREVGIEMGRTAATLRPSFIISTGDQFYENGVSGLDDPHFHASFEDIYTAPALHVPWHLILGNHDYRGNVQAQIDYSTRSKRWNLPARTFTTRETMPDGTKVEFFYLDTSPFVEAYRHTKVRIDGQDTAAQLIWLDRALGQSDAGWKIVVGHHPVHTVLRQKRDTPELIARLKPLLAKHRVPLYLNGHDHNLQVRNVDGIEFVTSGAGSQTSKVKHASAGEFASDQHGFMTASLAADALRYRFISDTGALLYEGVVRRG